MPFSVELMRASSMASGTYSTPTTFAHRAAQKLAIVPVPV